MGQRRCPMVRYVDTVLLAWQCHIATTSDRTPSERCKILISSYSTLLPCTCCTLIFKDYLHYSQNLFPTLNIVDTSHQVGNYICYTSKWCKDCWWESRVVDLNKIPQNISLSHCSSWMWWNNKRPYHSWYESFRLSLKTWFMQLFS
jgi:hypothetical protein